MRTFVIVLVAALPLLTATAERDAPLFHADADHTWNRAHRLLYAADATRSLDEQERLEPLFYAPDSRFLVPQGVAETAMEALDAVLADRSTPRIKGALQRVVFQHDLWNAFVETTGDIRPIVIEQADGRMLNTSRFVDQGDAEMGRKRERRDLQRRLVQAMRLAALSADEIKALPDNFADAVKKSAYPDAFDPKSPNKPFLPPDLLDKNGPWVTVGSPTQPETLAAPAHLATFKGRSVFTVLLRLPAGRKATEAFVKELEAGKLPSLPRGSQTALVRRMLLIDDQGRLQPTSLTESVQLRVYVDAGKDDDGTPFVFKLARAGLFAGKGEGLRPLEMKDRNCRNCHARIEGQGVRSIASLYVGDAKHPSLYASDREEQTQRSVRWVEKTYTWGLLQGMWEK